MLDQHYCLPVCHNTFSEMLAFVRSRDPNSVVPEPMLPEVKAIKGKVECDIEGETGETVGVC